MKKQLEEKRSTSVHMQFLKKFLVYSVTMLLINISPILLISPSIVKIMGFFFYMISFTWVYFLLIVVVTIYFINKLEKENELIIFLTLIIFELFGLTVSVLQNSFFNLSLTFEYVLFNLIIINFLILIDFLSIISRLSQKGSFKTNIPPKIITIWCIANILAIDSLIISFSLGFLNWNYSVQLIDQFGQNFFNMFNYYFIVISIFLGIYAILFLLFGNNYFFEKFKNSELPNIH